MLQKSLFWAPFFMQPPSRLSATPWECGSAPGSPALMAQCRWHGAGGMVPGHGCPTGRPHPGQLPGAWAWGSAPRELGLGRDRRSWQTFGENRLPPSRVPSKGEQAPRTPLTAPFFISVICWVGHLCVISVLCDTNRNLCVLRMWNTKATCWRIV